MGLAEEQGDLHGFIIGALIWLPNIDAKFSKLRDALFVHKLDLPFIRHVKNDPHNGLSCSDGAVNFGVNFVAANRIAFQLHK
jgi:hypothetical protein